MLKKMIAFLLLLTLCLSLAVPAALGAGSGFQTNKIRQNELSPTKLCPVRPTIYSMRRYRQVGKEDAYDTQKDFSASMIASQRGFREYGLYIKFTPGRTDDGYTISRFDTVLYDPKGNIIQTYGEDTDMLCEYGYFWYWDFYSLDEVFCEMLDSQGSIPLGTYTMDIYFNGLWAGKTQFRMQR